MILPRLKAGLNLSNVEVGAITSAQQVTVGLGQLPCGMLADAWVRRRGAILASSLVAMGEPGHFAGLKLRLAPARNSRSRRCPGKPRFHELVHRNRFALDVTSGHLDVLPIYRQEHLSSSSVALGVYIALLHAVGIVVPAVARHPLGSLRTENRSGSLVPRSARSILFIAAFQQQS